MNPRHLFFAAALGTIVVGLPPRPGFAADLPEAAPPGPMEELLLLKEETVSIAIRHEQPISEAPSNVYVITDEDIRQSGAPDLPTILRRIPGMEVMQTTAADFNVSVRGDNQLQANKLLVMVDGRSIYLDVQGLVSWKMLPVTLPEIKRIEVLKGPASVLYGFNAFDGIINIITKSPDEIKGTTLQFGGGEFGTMSAAAIHTWTQGKLGYRLSIGEDQAQQWGNRNALGFRAYKFNVQTQYALPGMSRIQLSGGLVDSNRFQTIAVGVATPNETPQQGYADLLYERPNFYARAWWQGYYNTVDVVTNPLLASFLRVADRNGTSILGDRSNTYNLEAQHAMELADTMRLTYGVNYRDILASDNFLSSTSREERLGFYIQDEWRATSALNVVAGVRYDLDTHIHGQFSPRFALLYTPVPDHTFRAAISVAYRPPTISETNLNVQAVLLPPLFPSPPPPVPPCVTTTSGSKDLNPEEIVSYDVGYQGWYFKHRLRARADLFFNHISNLIIITAPAAMNGPQADIYGGEAGVEFLATRWLTGFANYPYQEIGQSFTGEVARAGPRFKYNAGLRGEWENGLSGEIAWHYYGAVTYPLSPAFSNFTAFGVVPPNTRVASYNLLNLRGAYRFWQQRAAAGYMRDAEVALSAFNALNDKHREHPLGDEIGSRVMGWLSGLKILIPT
jgi:iron complex outermembrane receptor protein